jgi:hypothetical protein
MNVITQLTPKQLRRAADIQEKIIELQSELEQFLGVTPKAAPAAEEVPVRKRKKFSAAARAKMAEAQKARWAKLRAAKGNQAE